MKKSHIRGKIQFFFKNTQFRCKCLNIRVAWPLQKTLPCLRKFKLMLGAEISSFCKVLLIKFITDYILTQNLRKYFWKWTKKFISSNKNWFLDVKASVDWDWVWNDQMELQKSFMWHMRRYDGTCRDMVVQSNYSVYSGPDLLNLH